jgi:hypothetical protein
MWAKSRRVRNREKRLISIYGILSIEIIIRFIIADPKIANNEQPDDEAGDEPECQEIFLCFAHVVVWSSKSGDGYTGRHGNTFVLISLHTGILHVFHRRKHSTSALD